MRIIAAYVGIVFMAMLAIAEGDVVLAAQATGHVATVVGGFILPAVMFRDRVLGRWI